MISSIQPVETVVWCLCLSAEEMSGLENSPDGVRGYLDLDLEAIKGNPVLQTNDVWHLSDL